MVGRILRSADFERVLAAPPRARSQHFALHHLAACPAVPEAVLRRQAKNKLSTGDAPVCPPAVESLSEAAPVVAPAQCWLGTVVPKRHARRSVTRNLLKRQMRALMDDHAGGLPMGLWVLRLKAPFDKKQFPSAASDALRSHARAELQVLFGRAAGRPPARPASPAAPAPA